MATVKRELPVVSTTGALRPFITTGCSGAAFQLLNRAFGESLEREERASAYLAGGILTNGYQCGQVWGAALAGGAEAHRRLGAGPTAECAAVEAARRVVDRFRKQHGAVDCYDLTDTNWQSRWQMLRYMLRGRPVGCYRMLKATLPGALDVIVEALGDGAPLPPAPPLSCAAEMARRLGMSESQVTMTAGLAGGIGLSGGGCGALAVAVWNAGMREADDHGDAVDYKSPRIRAVIESFLQASDYEFECGEIVGRRFDGIADHAEHLADGGCAALMDALA